MSDRLRQSLMSSRSEIVAGLADAEAELARVRQRAAELEELIALGTATLLAAEMISGGAKGSPEPTVQERAVEEPSPGPEPTAVAERTAVPEPAAVEEPSPGTEPTAVPEPAVIAAPDAVAGPEPIAAEEPGPQVEVRPEPAQATTYEDDLRALIERAQS